MGSLKKLWGWYPTGNKWIKLQVDSNGRVLLSSIQTKARAYLSAPQINLVDGIWTKVLLDAESYDIGSNFASYKFTTPINGYYLIHGNILFVNTIANKEYKVAIQVNDVSVYQGFYTTSITTYLSAPFSDTIYLEKDDYVELYAQSRAGVNTVDIFGRNDTTFITIHLLSV